MWTPGASQRWSQATGPLAGRLLPPQSPGAGPLLVYAPETQMRVNLIPPALLANTLLPFGIELSLPQNSGGGAFTLTHQRPERLVQQLWLAGRGATLSPNQGISLGSLYLCSLIMWHLGCGGFFKGPSDGGCFLHDNLFS